jgi:E3 ubiquitin-protein ligase HERC2
VCPCPCPLSALCAHALTFSRVLYLLIAQVKLPSPCEALSVLRPVQLVGGEQTLFAVTAEGRVYATGYGAGGRLGIGGTDSVCTPTLLESIQHVVIRKV